MAPLYGVVRSPAIATGRFLHYQPRQGAYVYFRRAPEQAVMVVVNRNDAPLALSMNRPPWC